MNIGVIGASICSRKAYNTAYQLGRLIAQEKWILICGGQGGIMEAACKGAKDEAGITVGILPDYGKERANAYLDIRIPTGLGYARNVLVVRASDFLIAVSGKYGTLSEIAFALNEGKKVFGLDTWSIKGVIKVKSPKEVIGQLRRLSK